MNIIKPLKLSEHQLEDMKNIVKICNLHDGLNCSVDVDDSFAAPDNTNTFLLYDKNQLAAYIDIFAPKTTEAEFTAFTLPDFRRNGFFRLLLKEAVEEVMKRQIAAILFVCDRRSKDGQAAVRHLNAVYEYSEYLMKYNKTHSFSKPEDGIIIRDSEPDDIKELTGLALLSFDDSKEDAENYIKLIFSAQNRRQHVGIVEGKIAGMISTALEDGKSYIHGLCVSPEYRKRGIGAALLDYKVTEARIKHPENEIILEVLTGNNEALSIYKRAGFETTACYDYFRIASCALY